MSNTKRKMLPFTCGVTGKDYEFVFEKISGSNIYTYVRPQLPQVQSIVESLFVDSTDDQDFFMEEMDGWEGPEAQEAKIDCDQPAAKSPADVIVPGQISQDTEQAEAEQESGVNDISFRGCSCPECGIEAKGGLFDFVKCGRCQRCICPASIKEAEGKEYFTCPCGNVGSLSRSNPITNLEEARVEEEATRLQKQQRRLVHEKAIEDMRPKKR